MIAGTLLLIWGVGIVLLAFKIQSDIQKAEDPDSKRARELYDNSPILFCIMMAIALIFWPIHLAKLLLTGSAEKGK